MAHLVESPEGPIVDATLGGGGHSARLARAAGDSRQIVGIDQDPEAIEEATQRMAQEGLESHFESLQGNFRDLSKVLEAAGHDVDNGIAGLLFDLGVSSHQLDEGRRGFAIRSPEAELDMRMNADDDIPTARELVAELEQDELLQILKDFGEVKLAGKVAAAMKRASLEGNLETCGDLKEVVERSAGKMVRGKRVAPTTTVFQALRIAVNGELDALDAALNQAPRLLKEGGRAVFISYHSLEDRRVKQAFRFGEQGPPRPGHLPPPSDWSATWSVLTRKPIQASEREVIDNPRARSARLRVAARAPLSTGGKP